MRTTDRQYAFYLAFLLVACGGALVWQALWPGLGGVFTSWGSAPGWQREIALWNVGLVAAIALALIKRDRALMRLMTLQSNILCWLLGLNHLAALIRDPSWSYGIHIMGVLEVLLVGGIWGTILLVRDKKQEG